MDWENIKATLLDLLKNGCVRLLEVIGVLILGIIVIKLIILIEKSILKKTKLAVITQTFVVSISKFILNLILILLIIKTMGFDITGFIALITAAGLAVGLALQNCLANLANGIVIISTQPFKEGDYVVVNGVEGKISAIRMLTTTIVTLDNKKVILPNSTITSNAIINYNGNETRRVEFNFGVSYDSDTDLVKKIVLDVYKSDGRIKLEPKPFIALKTLNDSSISFFSYCWADSEDYWDVYFYVMEKVFNEFKKHNVSIPYNQMEVRLRKDNVALPYDKSKLPERVEKVKEDKADNLFFNLLTKRKKRKEKEIKITKEPTITNELKTKAKKTKNTPTDIINTKKNNKK